MRCSYGKRDGEIKKRKAGIHLRPAERDYGGQEREKPETNKTGSFNREIREIREKSGRVKPQMDADGRR